MTSERHAHQGLPDFKLHEPGHDRSRRKVVRAARFAALAVILVLLLGLGRTLYARWSVGKALEARAGENAVMHVRVIRASTDRGDGRLTLPGTLQATLEAQIYARANGYVKQWLKDIGDPVKKGEILAILDLPEVNQQVEEAAANYRLAKTAYERWSRLRSDEAVSQQELDEKTGAYRQAEAVLARLRNQQAFGQVVAPFDGIVTRRNVNVGDLVNAGNGGSGQALFAMAQTDKLHMYVYVPQDRAGHVKVGDAVDILLPDRPGEAVKGRVGRTAGAIDLSSRTLQVDVEVANPRHTLLPGAYVEAVLALKSNGDLLLPTNALLFGAAGTQVALVRDGKATRENVVLGTDYGRLVAVKTGVKAEDQVIVNPPDSIVTGQPVLVEVPQPEAASAGKPGK